MVCSHARRPWCRTCGGPRPKSVSWIRATKEREVETSYSSALVENVAMHALDPTNPTRPALEEALKRARHSKSEEQEQSTEQFLTRAKKRLVAEKEVVACTEKRDSLRAEMVSVEERLARLKDEVGRRGQDGHPVPNPQFHIPPEVIAELDKLRSMVANSMQVNHNSEIR